MMNFDRAELTRDAIEMSRVDGGFEVARDLLDDGDLPFTLIALYGDGQAYYLTREVVL